MTTIRIFPLAAATVVLLAACGSNDDGVKLGPFAALTMTEGDTKELTAPSSKSPAPFSYESSDARIARIDGNKVTALLEGKATITARQGEIGSYNPTSTSTTVTVTARVCTEPAVRQNGACVAPSTTAGYVTYGGLNWMPATETLLSWSAAESFCKNTTIKGSLGWRLPTQFELNAMVGAGVLAGQDWQLHETWTSGAGEAEKTHTAVNLANNVLVSLGEDKDAAVTCVKK